MSTPDNDTFIVNKTTAVGQSELVEEQRPDGIVGPLDYGYCHVCRVYACVEHINMCPECGGSGYGPDQMNGNEVFQDKCSNCDGEGRLEPMTSENQRVCTLLEEMEIEAARADGACGRVIRKARDRIIEAETLLSYYMISKVIEYFEKYPDAVRHEKSRITL